jgi:hypothetical protein
VFYPEKAFEAAHPITPLKTNGGCQIAEEFARLRAFMI